MRKKESKYERIQRYHQEGRGDWWFYPLWKKILYCITFPFIISWMCLCWLIMKVGHYIYAFGDLLSGYRWNGGDWCEDV